jgi:hypothetical protein
VAPAVILKPFGIVAQNVLELCPKVCLHKAYIHPNLYQMRCPICPDAAWLYLRTLHNLVGCYLWRLLQGMFGFAVNAIMEPSALQTIHTVPIAMFISVVADVELGAAPTPEYSAPQARKGYYTIALSDTARLVNVCPSHQKPEFSLHCTAFYQPIRLWKFRTMLVAHIGDHAGERLPLARCRSTQVLYFDLRSSRMGLFQAVKLTAGALRFDMFTQQQKFEAIRLTF